MGKMQQGRHSPSDSVKASGRWPIPLREGRFPKATGAMTRILLNCLLLAVPCEGQTGGCRSPQSSNLARILIFGGKSGTGVPDGWMGGTTTRHTFVVIGTG